jgi:hypothetical protein
MLLARGKSGILIPTMKLSVAPNTLYNFVASRAFFWFIIGFFTISSLYIALFSLYPMAFDENFHVGLIRAYSEHWLPFSIQQKPEYNVYGAVVTDPSYLYHYLMSFPYRLFQSLFQNEAVTIVLLRLINIGFCVGSLLLFRRLLTEAKVSPAITNVSFAFIVLIPVMPLLAGQVNYDNLLMLVLAYILLLVYRMRQVLVTEVRMPVLLFAQLVILLTYTSIIKYAFLPIAVAIVVYLAVVYARTVSLHKRFWTHAWHDAGQLAAWQKIAVLIVLVVGLGLFSQRYAVNIAKYHDPVPDCAVAVSVGRCMAYGPWGRDYVNSHNKPADFQSQGPFLYTVQDWSWGMWHRLFFTLAGPTNSYATRKPLPVISYMAIALYILVVLAALWQGRTILRLYPVFGVVLACTALYLLALWYQQYGSYVKTAQPVAINGRYVLPLLPMLGAFGLLSLAAAFRKLGLTRFVPVLAVVCLFLALQGGGPITYIVRSDPIWFWFNDPVQSITKPTRDIIKPFIIGD